MRILITGAAGFVGSSLIRSLLKLDQKVEIIGIDDFSFGYPDRIIDFEDAITFINCDVNNIHELEIKNVDKIIHTSAIAPLPECQISYRRTVEQNIMQCGSLIDFAIQHNFPDILFFSSGALYENDSCLPSHEVEYVDTHLAYSTSKFMAERLFKSYSQCYNANVACIRLFNLYGDEQDYFRKQPPLIGYLLKSLIYNEQISIYNSSLATRDYIHIDDLTSLIEKILQSRDIGFDIINACTGIGYTVNDIIKTLEAISEKTFSIKYESPANFWNRYSDSENMKLLSEQLVSNEVVKQSAGSNQKGINDYGWIPTVSLEQGLRSCFNYAQSKLG